MLNAVAATTPESSKPTPIEQFLGSHPAAEKFVKMPKLPAASFASQPFFGVNAFKFTNAKGQAQYGRYRITPIKGAQLLTKAQTAKATPNYLFKELLTRLAKAPAKFNLSVQIAEKGDVLNDATVVWPNSRKQVELGILTLKTVNALFS